MVLPVGGFFPIPLAMMIPFMATQSLVMGEAFGKAFQFGKRKISAMSNDEFNKLDIETVASEMFASYKNIEIDLKQSISDSSDFQNHIFSQLILLGPNLIKALSGAVLQDTQEKIEEALPKPDETAADVFKETPTPTPETDFKPIVSDQVGDPYKQDVFRNIWQQIAFGIGAEDAKAIAIVKQSFYVSFDPVRVRTLVIKSITYIQGSQKQITGDAGEFSGFYNQYRIVYHL